MFAGASSVDYLTWDDAEEAMALVKLLPLRNNPPTFEKLLGALRSVASSVYTSASLIAQVEDTWLMLSRTLSLPSSAIPLSGQQWDLLAMAILIALKHKRLTGQGGSTLDDSLLEMKVRRVIRLI